jgi:pimeloyl-ACP methyl ester carboxylesterase
MVNKAIRIFLLGLMFVYLAFCGFLYVIQDTLIYHPKPRMYTLPGSFFTFKNDGQDIVVTVKQQLSPKAIIYFGGNGEDVSQSLPFFTNAFPQHAIYLMHYRGYGGSTGHPSEEANYSDANALFRSVKAQHTDISIIGRSLGSGIATRLVSLQPAKHLVLVTPYYSIMEIASKKFPIVPTKLLMRDKYNAGQYAAMITTPTTILMAEHDHVIPNESTIKLFSQFKKKVASLILIENVDHNSISDTAKYLTALQNALSD